jgi:hypothetical protein
LIVTALAAWGIWAIANDKCSSSKTSEGAAAPPRPVATTSVELPIVGLEGTPVVVGSETLLEGPSLTVENPRPAASESETPSTGAGISGVPATPPADTLRIFVDTWVDALNAGSEDALRRVYAGTVEYEGNNRRTVSSLADKEISVRRLMPGAHYSATSVEVVGESAGRLLLDVSLVLEGTTPGSTRTFRRRITVNTEGATWRVIAEKSVP